MEYTFSENINIKKVSFDALLIKDVVSSDLIISEKITRLRESNCIGYQYSEILHKISFNGQVTKSWKLLIQFEDYTISIYVDYRKDNNYQEKEQFAKQLFKSILQLFYNEDAIQL